MKRLSPLLLSLGLAAIAATSTAATAAGNAKAMPSPHLLRAMARAQHLAQAAPGHRRLDTTPPKLSAFDAGTSADARQVNGGVPIQLSLTDDLSGIAYVYVEAHGPSGQVADVQRTFDFATRKAQASLGLMVPASAEPGTWQVTYMYAYDLAGNDLSLGQSALDGLGNTRFVVSNDVYDATPPRLVRGRILTPTVSASKLAKGVPEGGPLQSPGAAVAVTDSGGAGSAGVRTASMNFCMSDESGGCYYPTFSIMADNSSDMPGDASSELTLGAYGETYYDPLSAGAYALDSVQLVDFAGNSRTYTNKDFGGDTDFSKFFPGITIEVTP
jgi:hypothetical protein